MLKGFSANMPASLPSLIQDTQTLRGFCDTLVFDSDLPPFLTVDTEFIRERTYYPILCLIQVADAKQAVAIDPLAKDLDLAPFWELMARPDILKVFHAGRQDLEIFNQLTGSLPISVFDTQVAAMVCGFGEAASYEMLVKSILNKSIDKTSRFSDWSFRPLQNDQLTYALGDVIHLRPLYRWFVQALEKNQRQDWLGDEMQLLLKPETYDPDPQDLWKRLKSRKIQSLNPQALGLLKTLSIWREDLAKQKDLPRRHVLKDDLLVELAILKPQKIQDLERLRDPRGKETLENLPLEQLFEIVEAARNNPNKKDVLQKTATKLSDEESVLLDLLKVVLKYCAQQGGVAPKLLATSQDLERLVREDHPDIPMLKGWRFDLFGRDALAFKAGKRGFAYIQGKLTLCDL